MYNNKKNSNNIERVNRHTSIETGIYVGNELLRFCKTNLFHHEVEIFLPITFRDMKLEEAQRKYFSEHRPQIIKTNEDGSVNFTFNLVDKEIGKEQLEAVIDDFYQVLKRFQPMSVCLETGSELEEPVPFAWMEFVSNAIDENLYNMLTIYPMGTKLLMGMFNCPFKERTKWVHCIAQIRKSILIRNNK